MSTPTVITEHGSIPLLPMGGGGYELGTLIARGGMAELFLGRRVGPFGVQHPIVVKRLRDDMVDDPTIVRMFAWEAWIAARLRHPNIVRFHDFVVCDDRQHLVLEHVPGCDLARLARHLAKRGRPFPIGAAIAVALSASRALEHAHRLRDDDGRRLGLVHRDVSPHNVVLSVDGDVKLIDFGVAKIAHFSRDTGAGLIKGKMGYHAPEQLRGEPLDGRSDLYSLGVVLFELVAGRRFFSTEGGLRALLHPKTPALCDLRSDCPPALDALVRRALSLAPDGRFANARCMHDALRDVQHALETPFATSQANVRHDPASDAAHESDIGALVSEWATAAEPEPLSARDPAFALTSPRTRLGS